MVDPSECSPVLSAMNEIGWTGIDFIWNTHHHYDHVGGNEDLKRKFSCTVIGPVGSKIPFIDVEVDQNGGAEVVSKLLFESSSKESKIDILSIPGHTLDHIGYYFPEDRVLFSGDTVFAMGCGRLFEGTPQNMFDSLEKIKNLPSSTTIYAAHEYTQANAAFALHVDPSNIALQERAKVVDRLRSESKSTVPFSLHEELETNPFLRASSSGVFARLRAQKDSF